MSHRAFESVEGESVAPKGKEPAASGQHHSGRICKEVVRGFGPILGPRLTDFSFFSRSEVPTNLFTTSAEDGSETLTIATPNSQLIPMRIWPDGSLKDRPEFSRQAQLAGIQRPRLLFRGKIQDDCGASTPNESPSHSHRPILFVRAPLAK